MASEGEPAGRSTGMFDASPTGITMPQDARAHPFGLRVRTHGHWAAARTVCRAATPPRDPSHCWHAVWTGDRSGSCRCGAAPSRNPIKAHVRWLAAPPPVAAIRSAFLNHCSPRLLASIASAPNAHVDRPRRANASQRSGRTCCYADVSVYPARKEPTRDRVAPGLTPWSPRLLRGSSGSPSQRSS